MIKLAIFGDSFADDRPMPPVLDDRTSMDLDIGFSYIDIIKQTGKYEIVNFALAGSNVYYSKKLFDKHYKDFDLILFVVSAPVGRFMVKIQDQYVFRTYLVTFHEKTNLEQNPEMYTDEKRRFIKAADEYYMYFQNDEYEYEIHNLMLKDIREKSPTTIFIPAFEKSVPWSENKFYLHQISEKEVAYFNIDLYPALLYDMRKCHMCEENHKILAKKIIDCLEGKALDLSLDDFVNPTKEKTFYFRVEEDQLKFKRV